MASLDILERQHKEIKDQIGEIRSIARRNHIEKDSFELASKISFLAGKIKIHLQTEDRVLYPNLLGSKNIELKELANKYVQDMGSLLTEFEGYKVQFNTKNKIEENAKIFIEKTNEIFDLLLDRLEREDRHLYPLIKKENNN